MEKNIRSVLGNKSSIATHNELTACCINCGKELGSYTPPCNGHRFRCPRCKAELELHTIMNETGIWALSCSVLSTKSSRPAKT